MIKCNYCGREMNDGDKFCPGCGAAAGQPAPTAPAPQPAPEASAKKKKISGGTIFFIIIMLFIVGAGLIFHNAKNGFTSKETTINGTTYQLTYSGSTVVMKGTREGGIFEPDDAYKSTAEKLFEEFVDEYGLALEGIEFIGEGLSNLFR